MLKKSLVTISLLLPLAALSATAQAGSTITDKSYWPNEAWTNRQFTVPAPDRVNSAFAYHRGVVAPAPGAIENRRRYQGGPKLR
jgi:hypothetical protein